RGELRGVRDDINRSFAVFAELASTRIRPDHHRQTAFPGLAGDLPQVLVHLLAMRRAWIDRVPNGAASQLEGIPDTASDSRHWIFVLIERVVIVELEDQRDLAGIFGGAGRKKSQRRRVAVTAGIDRQLKVKYRIVAWRIR